MYSSMHGYTAVLGGTKHSVLAGSFSKQHYMGLSDYPRY